MANPWLLPRFLCHHLKLGPISTLPHPCSSLLGDHLVPAARSVLTLPTSPYYHGSLLPQHRARILVQHSWPPSLAPHSSPHFPPCSSYSTLRNHGLFLLERGVRALGPAWPSVLQPLSQQGCPGWVPDSTGAPPASGQTRAALGSLRAGMRDGFMASLQEGRNSQRSAPFLSLLRGVTAAVTAAACLGGGSSGRELAYQIYPPSPLGHSTRLLPWLREGWGEVRLQRGGVEWVEGGAGRTRV